MSGYTQLPEVSVFSEPATISEHSLLFQHSLECQAVEKVVEAGSSSQRGRASCWSAIWVDPDIIVWMLPKPGYHVPGATGQWREAPDSPQGETGGFSLKEAWVACWNSLQVCSDLGVVRQDDQVLRRDTRIVSKDRWRPWEVAGLRVL